MRFTVMSNIVLLLLAFSLSGCAGSESQRDPYNDADSQRSRSDKAQDEMSRDTSRY